MVRNGPVWNGGEGDQRPKKASQVATERTKILSSVFFLTDDYRLRCMHWHANGRGGKNFLCSMGEKVKQKYVTEALS